MTAFLFSPPPVALRAAGLLLAAALALVVAAPALAQSTPTTSPPLTPAAPAQNQSGCQAITPPDAPFACLEVFPLGASARVWWDGIDLGLSPLAIPQVEPGTHTLRLDRTGSMPWVADVTLEPGESRRIDPPLAPLPPIIPPPGPIEPYPLAVMVENHADARPHWGLDTADVIYEALAEGGISRFLAIYLGREAEIIGPVRSTRHYFVYTAAEYNSTLVHVGASPIGYAALGATGIRNVNESWGDPGIWRSLRREAPHDAFTGTAEARVAADEKGPGGPGSWGPLLFKDPHTPSTGKPLIRIDIDYPPGGWYSVAYDYDPERNEYLRWMDGYPHRDAGTGQQLVAKNVIVQIVPDEVIDREGRLDLALAGEGPAYYLSGGTVLEGTWTKADMGSRTLFWDTAGNLVRLDPTGTTWIQLLPPEGRLALR